MMPINKVAIIWTILIVFVAVGIAVLGNASEYSQVEFNCTHLNLLDGYWFTTATATHIPAEIKFLDDGTFVVTVKDEHGNVSETYVGTYALDTVNCTLEMDLNSTVVVLSLYEVQANSFSGTSAKHDLGMSFQRRF